MDQTFRAIIEVVNRASAPLHRIEADIAGLVAPITAVTVALGALAEETGILALSEHAAIAIEKVGHLGREIGALLGPVALIGSVISAEGLLEVSKKASEFGEKLLHQADKTGIDVPVLARLHYVARLEDVDEDAFDKAITKLNVNMFKAMHGKNKDLNAMLTRFEGPNWRKQVKTVEDGFGMIADAYNKAKNPFAKGAVAATAFGAKMGAGMVPVLLKGREAIKSMGDEFERFNGVWSRGRAEEAAEAADNWKRLSVAGEGLAMTIGSAITPSLMKLIQPLTEWIAKNRELVAAKVDRAVTQIGNSLKDVDWSGIADAVKSVWSAFKGLADLLGAKGMIFLGAAVIFGPIAKSAIEAAWAIGVLATQTGIVAMRIGALAGLQVLGFFTDLAAGIRLAIPALGALDIALSANPIGAAVLALSALAGLGLLIYQNWAPISKWFSDLWAGIKHELEAAWAFIEPIVDKIAKAVNKITGGDVSKYAGGDGGAAEGAAYKSSGVNNYFSGMPKRFLDALPIVGGPGGLLAMHDLGAGLNGRAGGGPARGQVDVNVKLDGLPRGATTSTTSSGQGLSLNVGKSFAHG